MYRRSTRNDQTMCVICDLWWLWLLLFFLILAAILTRNYWLPYLSPSPTPVTPVPTSMPPATVAPEPTLSEPPTVTLGTGDVQITLRWADLNDLDLYVTDPAGEVIFHGNASSNTGGFLDVDSNRACATQITQRPVENIYWPYEAAPTGEYEVVVVLYDICDATQTSSAFSVTVLVDGVTQTFSGSVSEIGETVDVYSFTR